MHLTASKYYVGSLCTESIFDSFDRKKNISYSHDDISVIIALTAIRLGIRKLQARVSA